MLPNSPVFDLLAAVWSDGVQGVSRFTGRGGARAWWNFATDATLSRAREERARWRFGAMRDAFQRSKVYIEKYKRYPPPPLRSTQNFKCISFLLTPHFTGLASAIAQLESDMSVEAILVLR